MSLAANFRLRIKVKRAAHVKRFLAGKTKLDVAIGQEVQPQDILGRSTISAGFSSINIANALHVSPNDGGKYLQKPIGKVIYKGELLALKKGIFGEKVVKAPTDGLLEFYDHNLGEIRLQLLPKNVPLTAGVFGIVDGINNTKNEVIIKTFVTEVFGILGSGNERGGVLEVLTNQGGLINQTQIEASMHQHILVAGGLVDGGILKKAAGFGLSGIICGGLNVYDYKAIAQGLDPNTRFGTDIGISVVATEGFGLIPIGDDIFNLIKNYNNKFVFINGNAHKVLLPTADSDSILSLRKISLPVAKSPEVAPDVELKELAVGARVRIIWPPFMGSQGKIVAIDKTTTVLESGIPTIMLTLETPTQKLKVPFANVEIIE